MSDSGTGEKTEEPTPERLRKLRKDGNVPKSQDVNVAIGFLVTFAVLAGTIGYTSKVIIAYTLESVRVSFMDDSQSALMHRYMLDGTWAIFLASGPVLLAAFVSGIAANVAQVGFMFTTKPISPDFKKLNPVTGFKNLFNMKKVVEFVKTILKFVLVSVLSILALSTAIRDVALMLRSELDVGIVVIGYIIFDFCLKIGVAFLVIAAFDLWYQRRRFIKDNMMSHYDIKQEFKQSEGDPQHKAERKRLHQEIINDSSPAAVKKADVVVRNPDHIAVALRYDKDDGGAPEVLAKGQRIHAEKILDAARRYGVPVVRNVPLAQALNKLDVGDEIPEELYEAVAEVLNFVYSLAEKQKEKDAGGG